jgi:hypothetical protein
MGDFAGLWLTNLGLMELEQNGGKVQGRYAIRGPASIEGDATGRRLDFAEARLKDKGYRDAVAAYRRAKALKLTETQKKWLAWLGRAIDDAAYPGAKEFLVKIRANKDGNWIDGFLAYRDDFEFADADRAPMTAFKTLRDQHEGPAKKALGEARAAFWQGRRDDGYAKYQEIVDKHSLRLLAPPPGQALARRAQKRETPQRAGKANPPSH